MSLEIATERKKTIGRNDACPCGSGKKYKKCHQTEDAQTISAELTRLKDEADAEAAAKAKAEEEESDTDKSDKEESKGRGTQTSQRGSRGASGAGQGKSRPAKGAKAQSLPRRGAV